MTDLKKSMSQKLRMDGRDYALPGWYFVTMGADYHRHFFGEVDKAGRMQPNALGQLVDTCWAQIPGHYGHIALGAWQVMPNHFHGIVRITQPGGKGLGEVMNVFKGAVTRQWRRSGGAISRYHIVCSTFFSPGERACLEDLQSGKSRIIWVQPMAMPASIPVNWTTPFLENCALWLSAFPDDQPDATRETCQMANRRVETLCAAPPYQQDYAPLTAFFRDCVEARLRELET